MAYGVNSPFGLVPYGHLISGVNDIKTNSNYKINANSYSLNKGDPDVYATSSGTYSYAQSAAEIMLYNPTPVFAAAWAAGTPLNVTTITHNSAAPGAAAVATPKPAILGVFQGCSYYAPDGTYIQQEYWVAGTQVKAGTYPTATIIDDPFVIWDIQLSCYSGALTAANTTFALLPCLQVQDGTWPDTGNATNAATIGNSAVIGSGIELMTGSAIGATNNSASSMATITLNGAVAGYANNPLIANYGAANGNPWGVSTFYACPSLAVIARANAATTAADISGANEYNRNPFVALNVAAPGVYTQNTYASSTLGTGFGATLKVLGFTPNAKNVPGTYGQPGNARAGTYYNTPFLNVLVTINNHAKLPGLMPVTVTA
jgi:hypothetical protein